MTDSAIKELTELGIEVTNRYPVGGFEFSSRRLISEFEKLGPYKCDSLRLHTKVRREIYEVGEQLYLINDTLIGLTNDLSDLDNLSFLGEAQLNQWYTTIKTLLRAD